MEHSTQQPASPRQETLNYLRLFARVYNPSDVADEENNDEFPPQASC